MSRREYANVRRILVVCTGNTCRSPMAEALLRLLLDETLEVESAGIDATDGLPPTGKAVSVTKGFGIDITRHRSRDLQGERMMRIKVGARIRAERKAKNFS